MCTVSFLPKSQGFYVAMNRDEKRDRVASLPPEIVELESRHAVFPREPTGGTWISVNDAGICLALINWHRIVEPASGGQLFPRERNRAVAIEARNSWATQPVETTGCLSGAERVEHKPKNDTLSRGLVIKELAGKSTANEIATAVKKLPLRKLRPFRLVAIVPGERRVIEWRWNLQRLAIRNHEWRRRHWFSSGFDEQTAERVRTQICASFVVPPRRDDPGKGETSRPDRRAGVNTAGYNLRSLRRLHRSHAPKRGPFSICMHRPDAETVSYTEVIVSKQRATMRYTPGPPCSNGAKVTSKISLALAL